MRKVLSLFAFFTVYDLIRCCKIIFIETFYLLFFACHCIPYIDYCFGYILHGMIFVLNFQFILRTWMAISVFHVCMGWCLTKIRSVVRLRHALMVKYLGNKIRCTSPNVCLGNAKYKDRPVTYQVTYPRRINFLNFQLLSRLSVSRVMITWDKCHPNLGTKMHHERS